MFFVIGVDPKTGHKYTETAKNIDEAKFLKDRLGDIGVTEVYITKPVDIEVEERNFYFSESFSEQLARLSKELSGYAHIGKI